MTDQTTPPAGPTLNSRLRFGVLGPLEIVNGTGPIALGTRKQRALLAMLLCRPNAVVTKEQLVAALWGTEPPKTAVKNLQVYVHHARRALGPGGPGASASRILRRGSGYTLLVGPDELDAERFERLAEQARHTLASGEARKAGELLRSALRLWRGPALADLRDVRGLRDEALKLEERRLAVLEERIDADLAAGQYPELVAELTGLVAEQPFRERARGQLMVALYRSGRQVEALEVYRQGRRVLSEQLGLEPGPALQRLEQAILRADPALGLIQPQRPSTLTGSRPAPRPAQLPPAVADFTGRAEQAELLSELLTGGRGSDVPAVVVVAVAGKGGVGKTALAVHVAHRVRGWFPDGQLYVNLAGASAHPADPAEVLDWLLRALGVDGGAIPAGLAERAALYRDQLDGRRVLVVLDDAAAPRQVRALLPGSPSCGVLVTSRTRLGGLEGARLIDLDVLTPGQAVELLGRIAGPERVAAEPEAAEQIVRLCGLLPLAVRVAGARLAARAHRPLAWLAGRLVDERHRLDELAYLDLEVRASLELSYQALDADWQRAFRLLGMLPVADFAAWAASALLDVPLERAEELLEGLADAQLLEVASYGPAGVRWRFHDLLRVYARELGQGFAEAKEDASPSPLERFLGACLALAEQAALRGSIASTPNFSGTTRRWPLPPRATSELLADAMAWFEAERGLLVGAVELACEAGLDEAAWELAHALHGLSELRGFVDDWRHTHDLALAAVRRAGNHRGEAVLLYGLGMLSAYQDLSTEAMGWFEQAEAVFEAAGELYGEKVARAAREVVIVSFGRRTEALADLQRALPVLRQAYALRALGARHLQQGALEAARACFEEGLAVARRAGYRYGQGHLLRWLAETLMAQGEPDAAVPAMRQSETTLRQLGARLGEAYTLSTLGELYQRQGQFQQARAVLERSLWISSELGDSVGEAFTLQHLGSLHLAQRRPQEAIRCLRRSQALFEAMPGPLAAAKVSSTLGDAYEAAGDQAAARTAWDQALAVFRQFDAPEAEALAQRLAKL